MTTKNLLYNRWFSDQIEPHRCGIKTHPQPFGKRAKNVEKVEHQSQLLDEYLDDNGRLQELEKCAHHNPRNGRNSRVGRPRSCKSCDFFHSLGFDGSHIRIPPFGTFFYLQDVRWGVVFGHPPFGAFFSAFPKGVLGVFYGSGIPIDPRTIGCIEGFLWFYSHLQFCFKGLARKTNKQHLECICFPLEFLRWLVAETHLVLPSHSKAAIGLYLVGVYPRIFLESVKGFGH